MKKFKLVSVNEWTAENISNLLDESIYQILIKDLTPSEKIIAYKEKLSKYTTSFSSVDENITDEKTQNFH